MFDSLITFYPISQHMTPICHPLSTESKSNLVQEMNSSLACVEQHVVLPWSMDIWPLNRKHLVPLCPHAQHKYFSKFPKVGAEKIFFLWYIGRGFLLRERSEAKQKPPLYITTIMDLHSMITIPALLLQDCLAGFFHHHGALGLHLWVVWVVAHLKV